MPQVATPPVRPDGLQLDENRRYQERLWTVERWAWGVFLAVTLAAALGATGAGGPISRNLAVVTGGEIDVPRMTRWEASDKLTVRFAAGSGERTLLLTPQFARSFQVEAILPQPQRVVAASDGHTIHFAAGNGPAEAVLHLRPQSPGLVRYRVGIDGSMSTELSTLILP